MVHVLPRLLATGIVVALLTTCTLPGRGAEDGEIYVADADGEGLVRLTHDAGYDFGPVWSPDGTKIAFMGDGGADIYVMNADGSGRVQVSATPEPDMFPVWSPDGTRLAFATFAGGPTGSLVLSVVAADGSDLRQLNLGLAGGMAPGCDHRPAWSPDGTRLLFCVASLGGVTPATGRTVPAAPITRAETGTVPAAPINDEEIGTVSDLPISSPPAPITREETGEGGAALYVINQDGSGLTRLTDPTTQAGLAAWSPDGSRIAFNSTGGVPRLPGGGPAGGPINARGLYVMNADGTAVKQVADLVPDINAAPSWSPDGRTLLVTGGDLMSGAEVWAVAADGSGTTNLTRSDEPEYEAAWSPDGTRIAFIRASGGAETDLYVMNADGSGQARLPSTDLLEGHPAWSPDGTKVAFDVSTGESSGA